MIEQVRVKDLSKVVDLAKWFYHKLNPEGEFCAESFVSAWTYLLQGGMALILRRGESEAIGVILYPDPNDGKLAAGVGFWYFADEDHSLANGLLYHELEAALRARNVRKVFFSNLINHRSERVEKFLLHAGYRPVEVHFRKDL